VDPNAKRPADPELMNEFDESDDEVKDTIDEATS
jgi:hypothetical protein